MYDSRVCVQREEGVGVTHRIVSGECGLGSRCGDDGDDDWGGMGKGRLRLEGSLSEWLRRWT